MSVCMFGGYEAIRLEQNFNLLKRNRNMSDSIKERKAEAIKKDRISSFFRESVQE